MTTAGIYDITKGGKDMKKLDDREVQKLLDLLERCNRALPDTDPVLKMDITLTLVRHGR